MSSLFYRKLSRLCCLGASAVFLSGAALALTDPTRPPDYIESSQSSTLDKDFAFSMLIFSHDRRVVVIESKAIGEGQYFEETQVIRIYPDRVLVSDEGSERVLYFNRLPGLREPR